MAGPGILCQEVEISTEDARSGSESRPDPKRSAHQQSGWFLLADPKDREGATDPRVIPAEAATVAGPTVIDAARAVLVRAQTDQDRCRLCGKIDALTKEHVPPRAAGNEGVVVVHSLEEWLRQSHGELSGGQRLQGGVWTVALCASCNSKTGSWYGDEYRRWVGRAWGVLMHLPLAELDAKAHTEQVHAQFLDVDPGLFVRQVLSLMCTLSGPWDLAGRHPEIRAMILDRQTGPLPPGLSLSLTLFAGPTGRVAGPSLVVDLDGQRWRWVLELAFPPLAVLMVLATNAEVPAGLDISEFTTRAPGERCGSFEAIFDIGFGHTPAPGDYRPAGALHRSGASPSERHQETSGDSD